MEGIFKGQCFENGSLIQDFILPNKITFGARQLIVDLLSTQLLNYTVPTYFGLNKFILFDIKDSCLDQMILGSFDGYDDFDPTYLTDITDITFPCLEGNSIIVDTVTSDPEEEPLDGFSLMSINVLNNTITFTIKIGKGYPAITPRKFALAGLFGTSSNSDNTGEFCYAIEQFPVMVKTVASTFKFEWICFI